jgi:hypothetical protein
MDEQILLFAADRGLWRPRAKRMMEQGRTGDGCDTSQRCRRRERCSFGMICDSERDSRESGADGLPFAFAAHIGPRALEPALAVTATAFGHRSGCKSPM